MQASRSPAQNDAVSSSPEQLAELPKIRPQSLLQFPQKCDIYEDLGDDVNYKNYYKQQVERNAQLQQ